MYSILFARASLFPELCPFLENRARELGYESFIRARMFNNKKVFTYVQVHQAQNYVSREEIIMFLDHFPGSVHVLMDERMSFNQWIKVDYPRDCFVCLFITSFHSFTTAAIASGIKIALGERSFAHSLGFPISILCLGVHTPYLCVHPEIPEQNNIRSLYFFSYQFLTWEYLVLPGFLGLLEEFLSHRYAVSRDETTCASFHLDKRKIWWRAFFRSFHWNEFMYQIARLHRIPSFTCNINTNEFCLRHFGSCYFGTTVSRMHVRFPKFWSIGQAIHDLNVMSSEYSSISPLVGYILFEEFRSIT